MENTNQSQSTLEVQLTNMPIPSLRRGGAGLIPFEELSKTDDPTKCIVITGMKIANLNSNMQAYGKKFNCKYQARTLPDGKVAVWRRFENGIPVTNAIITTKTLPKSTRTKKTVKA